MLHRSTDNNIVFPDLPDEWTTDAMRPPTIDEDFLINVGLHVHCQEYASGAKAIAIGNAGSAGSWVVNGDGTISPHDAPHLVLGWGDFTTAACWDWFVGPEPNNLVLLDAASPAGPVFRACGGASTDYEGPCTENCVACDGPGYEDCLECEPGYAHYDEDGDGGGSCCTPGYEVFECRDDGTPMRGVGCASCDVTACALHDATFDFGGRMTCEPGTSPIVYYHDYEDDGIVELDMTVKNTKDETRVFGTARVQLPLS